MKNGTGSESDRKFFEAAASALSIAELHNNVDWKVKVNAQVRSLFSEKETRLLLSELHKLQNTLSNWDDELNNAHIAKEISDIDKHLGLD